MRCLQPFHFLVVSLVFAGLAAIPAPCRAAPADAADPIRLDESQWAAPNTPVMPSIAPSHAEPPAKAAASVAVSAAPVKTVAAPARPIDLPVMPPMAGNIMLKVDSTAELTPARIVTARDGTPDLVPEEKGWQDAADAARRHADDLRAASAEYEPLNVRMSYLPNPKIIPIAAAERAPRPRPSEVVSLSKPVQERRNASCSPAVDKERQKQLDAIESDRKTLQALQSAIADLGLQKQLNFMTNASKGVTMDASQAQAAAPATATR